MRLPTLLDLASPPLRLALLLLAAGAVSTAAQTASDSAFAGVQRRGAGVMGVDQVASQHIFEDLPDGGRILYRMRDTLDTAGIRVIRDHLRTIEARFARGDFTAPRTVHDTVVPGTPVMARLRDRIRYRMTEHPAGGELRLTTTDPEALAAIRAFLAFQRSDHRAAGHEGPDHGAMDHSGHH